MDINTGIFTAKQAGRYLFAISALSTSRAVRHLAYIEHNDNRVASFIHDESTSGKYTMLGTSVILDLAEGDKVWVTIDQTGLYSNVDYKYTHFIGHSL